MLTEHARVAARWVRDARRRVVTTLDVTMLGCDLAGEVPPGRPRCHVEFHLATPADFPGLSAFIGPEKSLLHDFKGVDDLVSEFARCYERGDRCFIAESRRHIVHCAWVRYRDASLFRHGILVPIGDDEAYLYGAYTLPAYRGQGLQRVGLLERMRYVRARGIRAAYRWVGTSDRRTSWGFDLGWRHIGQVRQVVFRKPEAYVVGVVMSADPCSEPLADVMASRRLTLTRALVTLRRRTDPASTPFA